MYIRRYILDGHTPVLVDNATTWERWAEAADLANRRVGDDTIGNIRISTVFLYFDHNHAPAGPPLLFETMVFDETTDNLDRETRRYATWEEAEEGHREMVAKIKLQQTA